MRLLLFRDLQGCIRDFHQIIYIWDFIPFAFLYLPSNDVLYVFLYAYLVNCVICLSVAHIPQWWCTDCGPSCANSSMWPISLLVANILTKQKRLARGCAGLLLSEGSEPNNYVPFYNVQTESHIVFAATLFSVYRHHGRCHLGSCFVKEHKRFIQSQLSGLFCARICFYPSMQLQACSSCDEKALCYCTCVLSALSSHLWCPEKPARTNGYHTLRTRRERRLAILLSRHRASARGTTSNDGKRLPACW